MGEGIMLHRSVGASVLFSNGLYKEKWQTFGDASAGDTLHVSGYPGQTGYSYAYLAEPISLAGFNILEVKATKTSNYSGQISLADIKITDADSPISAVSPAAVISLPDGEDVKTELDISGLDSTKKYKIVIQAYGMNIDGDVIKATVDASLVRLRR